MEELSLWVRLLQAGFGGPLSSLWFFFEVIMSCLFDFSEMVSMRVLFLGKVLGEGKFMYVLFMLFNR